MPSIHPNTKLLLSSLMLMGVVRNVSTAIPFENLKVHRAAASKEFHKIIGGDNVPKNKYPWFSTLSYIEDYGDETWIYLQGCGGMLVSPEWVLTAAHCIDWDMRNRGSVMVGAYDFPYLPGDNGGQYTEFFYVDDVIEHPDFKWWTNDNDFALIHIDIPSTITPVALDSGISSYSYSTGQDNLWAIGHGNTDFYYPDFPDKLRHVEVRYVSNEDCTSNPFEYFPSQITDNMMCAYDIGRDSCNGDSGGPLYDAANKVVMGIVSWGDRCAFEEFPGVYSRISAQYDWIKDIICDDSYLVPYWCEDGPAPIQPTPPTPHPTRETPPTPHPTRETPPTPHPTRETPPTPRPTRETPPTPRPTREIPPSPRPTPAPTRRPIPAPDPIPAPTPDSSCNDSAMRFKVVKSENNKIMRNCVWVSNKPEKRCTFEGVKFICSFSCDKCNACKDSTIRFKVTKPCGKKIMRDCVWVSNKPEKRCTFEGVKFICSFSCDKCNACKDSTIRFKVTKPCGKKIMRDCVWVSNKPEKRCTLYGVTLACRSSCGAC